MTAWRLDGFRGRLFFVVGAALLPVVGLLLYNALAQRRQAIARGEDTAIHLARLVANAEEEIADGARQLLSGLALLPQLAGTDPRPCTALLPQVSRRFPQYAALGVTRRDGRVVCAAAPPGRPVSFADRPVFRGR